MHYKIPKLPIKSIVLSDAIWKKTVSANKIVAELRGLAQTIPNQEILISTLLLQESKDSSEIESIVTTHDDLFKFEDISIGVSPATKEVLRYREALYFGFNELKKKPLTNNLLIEIVKILTARDSGFRNIPGTNLKNPRTGELIYMPPQDFKSISNHMTNLEQFINIPDMVDLDPLIKMAIIHHQFESIHPFFDGNGRTGRILNILYLISSDILDIPILYLSRYIIKNKADYYRLLQKVRNENTWEEWILYMLNAVESTAGQSIKTIIGIKKLMLEYKEIIKRESPRLYSHELINTIFSHPYTKINFVAEETGVNKKTASRHLQTLSGLGLLTPHKSGRIMYYINTRLLKLFTSFL